LCFVLEETYFLEYATPTSPPSPGIPDLGISLRQTVQPSESWHYGWVREADRLPIQHWLDQGETIHLMPLRFGARFRGTDSWGNPALWRKGRAVWWVQSNGRELNKRKREHVIRHDSTTEDEDATWDQDTTEGEDEEEEREAKRGTKAKEESVKVKVKEEPISPPPLRRRSGRA
jgi:hypothetical protein